MNSINPLYLPYGAFELKAAYQRNMLMGMLLTTTVIAVTVLTSWLLSRGDEPRPIIPVPPNGPPIEVQITPQPSIVVERAPLDPSFAPPLTGGIPEPVPDEELGELDVVLPSREERATIIDDRYGLDDSNSGGMPGVFDELGDFIPPPDSFVSMEIYPVMIHQAVPEYPRFARDAGLEGTVHIKALVMPDGSVREAMVYFSSKVKSLDQAALSVAKQNVFKPGVQNGRPVPCWVTYQVRFELSH